MKTTATMLLSLATCFLMAQNNDPHLILQNAMMAVNPANVQQFEAAVASHNKKYHADETYGARIYSIGSGDNAGKYIWNMGPIPWSAYDNRPKAEQGHDADWNTKVVPHILAEGGNNIYWRFHPELSHFPKDFDLNLLHITWIDIERFNEAQMISIMTRVQKVWQKARPNEPFGVYMNQFRSDSSGMDFAVVGFMDNWSAFQMDDNFPKDYEAVHGAGSFPPFLEETLKATISFNDEIWEFRPDLSGKDAKVKAITRQ